ncbi:hypothetical protein NDI56_07205 [Haloarcula sp. S1CR25-12]|uniref:CARDB domain-containing protein n=1 Tax=Haloarcula saliterrae TaxID=2950534 RepID=A0ABU2FAF7_9EURY|nr:hypothetical protein [Haloarcula sp. S1CR25-12]MDS0259177.1 hypothetical protein [Haloarcula sp. S1CR25-12]
MILLVGLTLVGVVAILATGVVTIDETNQDANMEIAEESMLQIDSALEQDSGGNTSVSVPDQLEGKVAVSNDQSYRLTLNENSQCTTGSRDLSSVEYEENGQRVAYEGGGVWRLTESGATMTSPPGVEYDEGSLSVSFIELDGRITDSSEFTTKADTSEQRRHQFRLTRGLYTDGTYSSPPADGSLNYICRPTQVENATLTIENSQYARAWKDWAESNYDSDLVTVKTSGDVEPGDDVTIRYSLGDVSEAEYEVTDIRASRASGSGPVTVNATVENVGGLRERKDIELRYGTYSETKTKGIGGGDTKYVTFEIPKSEVVTGTNTMTVETPSDTANEDITFNSISAVPKVTLQAVSVPSEVAVDAAPSGANLEVINTGGMTAFDTVTMDISDGPEVTYNVTVAPGSSKDQPVGADLPTDNTGSHDLVFSSRLASSDVSKTLTIGDVGYFALEDVSAPSDVRRGETVRLEATVNNTGIKELRGEIDANITNLDTGTEVEAIDPTETPVTLRGTATGPDTKDISLSYTANTRGNYSYRLETPNETRIGQFYVGIPPGPNLIVRSVNITQDPVDMGSETTFEVEVANTGTEPADQTVRLNTSDGKVVKETDLNVSSGDSEEFDWTVTTDESVFIDGFNELNVTTENVTLPTSLNVKDPSTYSRNDDGSVTFTEAVNVTVSMEGAELEANTSAEGEEVFEYGVTVEMSLVIENESGRFEKVLWEDVPETGADVGHPIAERAMQQDDEPNSYTETLRFDNGTTFALYATSYYCRDWDVTDVVHPDRGIAGNLRDTTGIACDDAGGERLRIGQGTNTENVVIKKDGESVPAYDSGSPLQLTLDDMLGDEKIDDDGNLNLANGEAVFLYELSQQDADPANATDNTGGDPDYNDAIARFQVEEINKTVKTEPSFEITNVDVPARVGAGNDAGMEVTVRNNGGQAGKTPVEVTMDGKTYQKTTDELSTNETDDLTFVLDTSSGSVGKNYRVTASALETPRAEWVGFVTVGEPSEPFFQVSGLTGPAVADDDDSPEAAVNITNVGTSDGSQEVVLEYKNNDTASATWQEESTTTLSIDPGETVNTTLALPDSKGNYTYRVRTENVTSSDLELFVGSSDVYVAETNSINIGAQEYDAGTLVERKGSITSLNVELKNNGTVGDERDVRLEISNDSSTPVDRTIRKQVGGGDLLGQGSVPAYADFNAELDPGFYTYTITVYDDTPSDGPGHEVSGQLYLRAVSSDIADADNSPITIDSGTVTVG